MAGYTMPSKAAKKKPVKGGLRGKPAQPPARYRPTKGAY
jgi:hypothetical protein